MVRYASTVATAAALALAALLATAPAQAAVHGTITIQSGTPDRVYQPAYPAYQVIPAPPPPRHEARPRPRNGKVWMQGHWEWRGQRHAWVPGQWVKARKGQHYRQPQWDQRDGRWMMQRGGWDRDGDGVPNRHDRRPDNPRRH